MTSVPLLSFAALLLAGVPTAQTPECSWQYAKPIYGPLESELLRVRVAGKGAEPPLQREFSHNGVYWLALEAGQTQVSVGLAGGRWLHIDVPEYSWRPIEARRLNEKLLYLEVTFNPHAGAYWVFDVEKEKVVLSEHWLEDLEGYLRCHPHR